MPVNITIRYFAQLRDLSGKSEETVTVGSTTSASNVYELLAKRYGFPLSSNDVRVAINDEFASSDQIINDGDLLVFIPPVAGG